MLICRRMAQSAEKLSYEAYLELAASTEETLEYHDGVVVAMASPTVEHAQLCARLTLMVGRKLHGSSCEAFAGGLKIRVEVTNRTLVPDLTVVCGPPERSHRDRSAIVNPRIVVEVLSPSTEDYDQGAKFHHYRRIAGLQEIVFVAQDRRFVRTARRAGDLWAFEDVEEGTVRLESIGMELALDELYAMIA